MINHLHCYRYLLEHCNLVRCAFILMIVNIFCTVPTVLAWHGTGHMVTAAVAYTNLDHKIKSQIDELSKIGMEEYPRSNNFITMSVWPDDIKGHGVNFYNDWHYQSIFFSMDGTSLPKGKKSGRSLTILKKNMSLLKSTRTTNSEKSFALRFIVHVIGDMHQPMHNASLVSNRFPRGDMGGNLFLIDHKYKKLHTLWDAGLNSLPNMKRPLNEKNKQWLNTYTESLMAEYPLSSFSQDLIKADYNDWQENIMKIIKNNVYQNIEFKNKVSQEYLTTNLPIIRRQLALGGYRLANHLNCVFGSDLCVK